MTHTFDSPIGPLTLRGGPEALTALDFDSAEPASDGSGDFGRACSQLAEYFAGSRRSFTLPLDLGGTPFQRSVWEALRAIPYGETTTYAQLAAAIGRPRAVRAVAAAVGRTPVPIIVPCHRVVGSDGSLTGYRGGLERKRALLELEGASR
jgi:methylated-DNA-[protein]-cysteine S-methyltransferase